MTVSGNTPDKVYKPLPPIPEKKGSVGADPKATLGNTARTQVTAPATKRPSPTIPTKAPSVGASFGQKTTPPEALRYGAAKEVSSALKSEMSGPVVEAQKVERGKLEAELKKIDKEIEGNIARRTQMHSGLLIKKAQVEKKLALLNGDMEKVSSLEKHIGELERKNKMIAHPFNEIISTEKSYLSSITQANRYLSLVMEQDKKFAKQFKEYKDSMNHVVEISHRFNTLLEQAKTPQDLEVVYKSEVFRAYGEALLEYTKHFEKMDQLVKSLDFVKINKKLPSYSKDKVSTPDELTVKKKQILDGMAAPMQRIMRHGLLLQGVIDFAVPEDKAALGELKNIAVTYAKKTDERTKEFATLLETSQTIGSFEKVARPKSSALFRKSMAVLSQKKVSASKAEANAQAMGTVLSDLLLLSQSENRQTVVDVKDSFDTIKANPGLLKMINSNANLQPQYIRLLESIKTRDEEFRQRRYGL